MHVIYLHTFENTILTIAQPEPLIFISEILTTVRRNLFVFAKC